MKEQLISIVSAIIADSEELTKYWLGILEESKVIETERTVEISGEEEEEEGEQWVIVLRDKDTGEYEFATIGGGLSPEAPDAEMFDSEEEAEKESKKIQKKYPDKEVSLRTWSYLGTGRI